MTMEPLEALGLRPLPPGEGLAYVEYSLPRGARWLFPLGREARRAVRVLHRPQSLAGRLRHLGLMSGRLGRRVSLRPSVVGEWAREVGRATGARYEQLAFYQGNATALGKVTAVLLDDAGHCRALVKVGGELARSALCNEASVLRELVAVPGLSERVPRLLGVVTLGGHSGIATTVGPTRSAATTWGAEHEDFLSRLTVAAEPVALSETVLYSHVLKLRDGLDATLTMRWRDRYDAAFEALDRHAGGAVTLTGTAHRDFAPWNMSRARDGLYVFDWETAAPGYPVACDRFHFWLMTATFLRRRVEAAMARAWIQKVSGPGRADAGHLLLLAFLLDLGLRYHSQNQALGHENDDEVLSAVGGLLDSSADWWAG